MAGRALVQTTRHFFPELNTWLDRLPDTRVPQACTYSTRFLAWWGLALYLFQLRARRQLDFQLRDGGVPVWAHLNRLAQTDQTTLPVHDTLDHFLGHVTLSGWQRLRRQRVQRLLRMKALEAARLLGLPVLLLDGTGLICFHRRHCPHCLVQRHGKVRLDLHQVLEAKLLGPVGVVVSLGSEFIDNADATGRVGRSADEVKQDCERKAMQRLLPPIKQEYPQLRFVVSGDSLYAFALYSDGSAMTVCPAANTEEAYRLALEKSGASEPEEVNYYRWAFSEWDAYTDNDSSAFAAISDRINDRGGSRYDEQAPDRFVRFKAHVYATMVLALLELVNEGFFGSGQEREQLTLLCSEPDSGCAVWLEDESARRLNSSKVYRRWRKQWKTYIDPFDLKLHQ